MACSVFWTYLDLRTFNKLTLYRGNRQMQSLANRLAIQHFVNAYTQETGKGYLLHKNQQTSTQQAFSQGLTLLILPIHSIQAQCYFPLSYVSRVGRHRVANLPQIIIQGQSKTFSPVAIVGLLLEELVSASSIPLDAPTIIIFQTSYIVYGISVACLLPAFTTGAAQAVSAQAQVKMASYCTTTQAIGLIVGPLLSTALYQSANYLPFIFLLIANILLAIYFLWKFMFSTKVISTHIIAE
jgi:MFS family permease